MHYQPPLLTPSATTFKHCLRENLECNAQHAQRKQNSKAIISDQTPILTLIRTYAILIIWPDSLLLNPRNVYLGAELANSFWSPRMGRQARILDSVKCSRVRLEIVPGMNESAVCDGTLWPPMPTDWLGWKGRPPDGTTTEENDSFVRNIHKTPCNNR